MLEASITDSPYPLGARLEFEGDRPDVDVHATSPFDVGSAYKPIVAYTVFDEIRQGTIGWTDQVLMRPTDELSDSPVCAGRSGTLLEVEELARAMLEVSDNSATDLLVRTVGHETVTSMADRLGLHGTKVPASIREKLDELENGIVKVEDFVLCHSTAEDMCRFFGRLYDAAVSGNLSSKEIELLGLEDAHQQTPWPAGVTCLRKSGNIELGMRYSGGVAGVVYSGSRRVVFSLFSSVEIDAPDTLDDWQTKFRTLIEEVFLEAGSYLMDGT